MASQILYALPFLAKGFAVTLWVSLLVVTLSLVAGVLLGVGLVYGPAPLRWAVRIFSDTIRGIPILVLMFFVYYGLPAVGLHLPSFWAAVLALTLFKTAQVIEYLRGAVASIPKGQSEAAMALEEAAVSTPTRDEVRGSEAGAASQDRRFALATSQGFCRTGSKIIRPRRSTASSRFPACWAWRRVSWSRTSSGRRWRSV